MAFCCVLYLKEECDGCGRCEEKAREERQKGRREEAQEALS